MSNFCLQFIFFRPFAQRAHLKCAEFIKGTLLDVPLKPELIFGNSREPRLIVISEPRTEYQVISLISKYIPLSNQTFVISLVNSTWAYLST